MFKQVIGVSVKEGPLIVPCTDGLNNLLDFGFTRLLFGKYSASPKAAL